MRVSTTIPQHDLRASKTFAKSVETAGFTGLNTLENRHDPFLPLAIAATVTEQIELSTGIALAFVRSPMSVAHISWDLNVASRGRFVLGLGPQIRPHNEKRYSVPWSAPVPRLREYVHALRAIWHAWKTDEKLRFEGEHYRFTLMPPNFVPEKSELASPPITLAAVGPAMVRLAGEVADGIRLHPFCTRKYFEKNIAPCLKDGLSKSGKQRETFEVNGGGFVATGPDNATVHRMAEWVRYRIGFYASTPAYWPVLEAEGYPELGPHLNRLTKAGQWDQLAKAIPDDLLQACTAIGRHDEIGVIIEKRFTGVTDTLQASASAEHPSDMPADLLQDLLALPTPFKGFSKA